MFKNQSAKNLSSFQNNAQNELQPLPPTQSNMALSSPFEHLGSVDIRSIRDTILNASRSSAKVSDLAQTTSEIIRSNQWLQVKGMARFWSCDDFPDLITATTDAVSGIHAIYSQDIKKCKHIFLISSILGQLNLYYGSQAVVEGAGVLRGCLPGIILANNEIAGTLLQQRFSASGLLKSIGCLIGVPKGSETYDVGSVSFVATSQTQTYSAIDRVIRGMGQVTWGYVVYAYPLGRQSIENTLTQYSKDHTRVSSVRRMSGQTNRTPTNQTSYDAQTHISYNESKTISQEIENHEAKKLSDLLDYEVSRTERGLSLGMWQAQIFFFTSNPEDTQRLGGLLCSAFRSSHVKSEPLQFKVSNTTEQGTLSPNQLLTTLVSDELATLTGIPSQEFAGYPMREFVQFDSDTTHQHAIETNDKLNLGGVLNENKAVIGEFSISRYDLAKHTLVVGVTGSGKTTSIFRILQQLTTQNLSVPFLIIEPAKTEYRRLLQHPVFKDKLVVYTPGKENCAPFRFNPFEFDVLYQNGQRQATLVHSHIDFLKSVFNAAFILYAPMPYVLDMALHEIYQDKGWNIALGSNARLFKDIDLTKTPVPERSYPVFPTLTDLRNKIAEVVVRLGYEARIQMDVIAGLQARIDSLRLGAKGLMLDVSHGVSMDELVNRPTVIELEALGNDDEKSFLMGMVMARLYEYQRLRGYSTQLRHITVVEEAHRLLKHVNTDVGTEEANNKAMAVGVFANMLSEVRAYGEGLIIAEQIPSKLAPDVIKNTNLKLLHRMVSQDDRDAIGAAMNLSEQQSIIALTLSPKTSGTIAYAEGDDRPYLLKVQPLTDVAVIPPSDDVVQKTMQAKFNHKIYEPAPGLMGILRNQPIAAKLRSDICEIGGLVLLQKTLTKIIYRMVDEGASDAMIDEIRKVIITGRGISSTALSPDTEVGGVIRASHLVFQHFAMLQSLPYVLAEAIYTKFLTFIAPALQLRANNMLLTAEIQHSSKIFTQAFNNALMTQFGPHAGCELCKTRCHYQVAALNGLDERTLIGIDRIVERKSTYKLDAEYWQAIADKLKVVAESYKKTPNGINALRLCMATTYAHIKQLPEQSQVEFVNRVAR